MNIPTVTLTNGVVVANFSSPHEFTFVDGSVLGNCSKERAGAFPVLFNEERFPGSKKEFTLLRANPMPSEALRSELERVRLLAEENGWDVVLVPFLVVSAIKNAGLELGPFASPKMESRTDKRCKVDEFCI